MAQFFAEAGAPARARELLDDYLTNRDPDLAWLHSELLAETRAAILIAEDSADAALRILLDLRGPRPMNSRWFDDPLLPRTHRPILARAYARAGQADSAMAVWQRYLDAPVLHRAELDAFHLAQARRQLKRRVERRATHGGRRTTEDERRGDGGDGGTAGWRVGGCASPFL